MSYEDSFAFAFRPFVAVPSADRYFPGSSVEAARATLSRCIERDEGPGMILGSAGIGKTLLLEVLAKQFHGALEPARLTGGHLTTRRALLQVILFELGLPYRGKEDAELRLTLIEHLTRPNRDTRGLLLLVDEAHNLPVRLLEEIRMVTNICRGEAPRVHLVLAGGPALEEKLTHPKLDSLSQRLAARCYLEPLSRTETTNYLAHEISRAGGDWERLFPRASCEAVYRATAGIPRLINQVADYALMLAFGDDLPRVEPQLVERAWADLQQMPAAWVTSEPQPQPVSRANTVEFGQLSEEPETDDSSPRPLAEQVVRPNPDFDQALPSEGATTVRAEATLSDVEAQLANIDVALPAKPAKPAPRPRPVEVFEHEEVLVDPYAAATASKRTAPVYAAVGKADFLVSPARQPDAKKPSAEPAISINVVKADVDATETASLANQDAFQRAKALLSAQSVMFSSGDTHSADPLTEAAASSLEPRHEPEISPVVEESAPFNGTTDLDGDYAADDTAGGLQTFSDSAFAIRACAAPDASVDFEEGASPATIEAPQVVVLDDAPAPPDASAQVRRQEYRQLFARMRRGS